jgi:arabinofuranosyltransferase
VGVGLLLNLVYVVAIGGDYMAGRFLSAAYLVAAAVLVRTAQSVRAALPLLAGVALYAALSPTSPLHTRFDAPFRPVDAWGVGDTRNNFSRVASIRSWLRRASDAPFPDHAWSRAGAKFGASGTRVSEWPAVGIYAYHAGLDKVVIDRFALADPLLARLPSRGRWRVGHFRRAVPSGYLKSVRWRQNFIVDPELREFYEHLRAITEGELVSRERFATIVRMNLGLYDHLLPERGEPYEAE